jgi:D-arabinose 1-dehydrogenase-like Zn-dependent alcohol dehydrogenase
MILAQAAEDIWLKLISGVGGAGGVLLLVAIMTRRVILKAEHDEAIARCDSLIKRLETDLDEEKARAEKWEQTAFQAVAAAKQSTATTEKAIAVVERTAAP